MPQMKCTQEIAFIIREFGQKETNLRCTWNRIGVFRPQPVSLPSVFVDDLGSRSWRLGAVLFTISREGWWYFLVVDCFFLLPIHSALFGLVPIRR